MELADKDWELLSSLLPASWRELAVETKAVKGLRKDKSDVALLKRLRKSEEWLRRLCVELFLENGMSAEDGLPLLAVDGTMVKEPDRGSLWRLHYGVRLPSLECASSS